MSSKTSKTPKISQFFTPTSKNGEMEGTKGKKRVVDSAKNGAPKKAKQQKVERGGKKKKEKSAIKRASSAYIFFSKDFRNKLKEECDKKGEVIPGVNEVAKLCGERWRKMTDEDKKPFQKLADLDKSRYHKESGKGDLPAKDSDKPKRAPTAYFIFLAEFRKKMAGVELEDGQKIPALAGEKWRSMTDKDKEPYAKKEAEEKKKYEAAMESYREKIKDAPKPEKKSKPKKREEPEEEEEDEEDDDDEDDDDDDDDDDDE
ncbi:high mobility group protein B1-like isoform X1 [Actinia tenebrosa]|uniref:High mobility group protein B1-like isoform X1 n=1 Tax=Actinia tenebrosa TaxID=6105 RepID=A0A6P8HBL0_ACTTE|nr:high mobility group protein B1-like isoform X1 [Actinia tenebrosa]